MGALPVAVRSPSLLIIACGALAKEIVAVVRANGWEHLDVQCLPPELHNRPEKIPGAVRAKIHAAAGAGYSGIWVAYGDCGTGGKLDEVLREEGVERVPGAHCYEFFATAERFAEMADEEPGTFYLTDFLARHFDRLIVRGLGLDRHPELLGAYFGNYQRVVYLAQSHDPQLERAARQAADLLGLTFELRRTGYGDLESKLIKIASESVAWRS